MKNRAKKPPKTTITVTEDIKKRVCALKRGNQTYNEVLDTVLSVVVIDALRAPDITYNEVLDTVLSVVDVGERGEEGELYSFIR